MTKYEAVIGLEVHVELYTKSKMFCSCSADYFGKAPNTHVCPVCLGLPGALPVPNKQAIEWCVMIGLALNCEVPLLAKFDRKNYFYPDLPKGYQISQYDKPFCVRGFMTLSNGKKVRVQRAHMEEDTAKLTHAIVDGEKVSLVDFNRSGIPLVEIVTEPDFETADEVVEYLKRLQQIVRYLGVSSADMEKGDMRLEPNISVREIGNQELPKYKVEVKNINSFRFVERAIEYEVKRQSAILGREEIPKQETRGWNEQKQVTFSQRSKEEVYDYRYFPEPDIPPIRWDQLQIEQLKKMVGEMPDAKKARFAKEYGLSAYDAQILTREKQVADYFEEAVKDGQKHNIAPKQIANYLINKKPDIRTILPARLVQTIVTASKITTVDAKQLEKLIGQVLLENPKAVSDYKIGKVGVVMFLVGQLLRKLHKRVDPQMVKGLIEKSLKAQNG